MTSPHGAWRGDRAPGGAEATPWRAGWAQLSLQTLCVARSAGQGRPGPRGVTDRLRVCVSGPAGFTLVILLTRL